MNYQSIYDSLITNARNRTLSPEVYTEKHHILPRCLGGTNHPDNIVKLTAREHYIAHQILAKLHRDNTKLVFAATLMVADRNGGRVSNRLYAWLRKDLAKASSKLNTGRKLGPWSEDRKKRSSEQHRGKPGTRKGVVLSADTRDKISKSKKGVKIKPMDEDTKRRISESQKLRWLKIKERNNV